MMQQILENQIQEPINTDELDRLIEEIAIPQEDLRVVDG